MIKTFKNLFFYELLKSKEKYYVLGIMSGTSLDGLDLALCYFEKVKSNWKFDIIDAKTIPYNLYWKETLSKAHILKTLDFFKLHNNYGIFIGEEINSFLKTGDYHVNFIASHGHTIFHQPAERLTFQLGSGASVAATTKITTISDFRTLDVALGGNGAPLVPMGDEWLFGEYYFCLNLGGFANISFKENKVRKAYDICPVNIIINYLAAKLGAELDRDGIMGRNGKVNQDLLEELNNLKFYKQKPPKSLGREWFEFEFLAVLNKMEIAETDKLRTVYEHIAIQIYNSVIENEGNSLFITGGGAHNLFLIELIKKYLRNINIIIPDKKIVDYKEALIFAFLGVLRIRNEHNCLASVTGASANSAGGIINKI